MTSKINDYGINVEIQSSIHWFLFFVSSRQEKNLRSTETRSIELVPNEILQFDETLTSPFLINNKKENSSIINERTNERTFYLHFHLENLSIVQTKKKVISP